MVLHDVKTPSLGAPHARRGDRQTTVPRENTRANERTVDAARRWRAATRARMAERGRAGALAHHMRPLRRGIHAE